ncbi:hypothetical protein LCGC14_1717880 [marine sediment metagenome]|uniref:Uncharacterized protein n=1 Tax=marine sediment metagenome TaxID=412755 RepID=A0A0F9HD16_9ZZZZ
MKFTDEQIEFMRQDLESYMSLTRMVEAVKKRLKEQDKDFNKEFEAYQKKKKATADKECLKKGCQSRIIQELREHELHKGY